jgi:hypothetical protein
MPYIPRNADIRAPLSKRTYQSLGLGWAEPPTKLAAMLGQRKESRGMTRLDERVSSETLQIPQDEYIY